MIPSTKGQVLINDLFSFEQLERKLPFSMRSNHYHDSYEIYYLLSGERFYFIKERTYHVKKGDLVLINKFDVHRTTEANSPVHERVLINFKKTFLSGMQNPSDFQLLAPFSTCSVINLNATEQGFVEAIFAKMNQEADRQQAGAELYFKMLLTELLLFIFRHEQKNTPPLHEFPNTLHKKVSLIVKYLNEHYATSLDLVGVASVFHVSPSYLSRVFKEVTGFSFIEYINQVRIKEAQKLLSTTNYNITSIFEKVGFESSTHFGRVFKTISSMSPLQYRKLMR